MSSRIIVKNLPRKVKESRLRELFSKHGDITQIKLLSKRRFAYVGFMTESSAKAAVEYRNETFIDATQIEVSLALPYGHDDLPRPWSKYSEGSSAFKQRQQEKKDKEKAREEAKLAAREKHRTEAERHMLKEKELLQKLYNVEANPNEEEHRQLKEYLEVMKPTSNKRTWADDGAQDRPTKKGRAASVANAVVKQVAARRPGGEGVMHVQKHLTFEDSDDEYQDLGDGPADMQEGDDDKVDRASDDVAMDDGISDMEYLRSKMKGKTSDKSEEESSDSGSNSSSSSSEGGSKSSSSDENDSSDSSSDSDSDDDSGDESSSKRTSKRRRVEESQAEETPKVFSVRMRGLPFSATEDNVLEFFHPLKPVDIRMPLDRQKRPSGRAYVDFETKADYKEALRRNKDHMGRRYVEVTPEVDGPPVQQQAPPKPERKFPELENAEEDIADSGRLFVRNLAYAATEDDLRKLFEPFGTLSECTLPIDRETQKSKAIAFITYLMPEHAVAAYQKLDGTTFQGRLLHILPGKSKHDESASGVVENIDEMSFRKKREAKRKSQSQNSFNWNTLFMRADTVADAMAEKYGVPKSQILDTEGDGSMAVRMALGETHVIAENKEFLAEHGVVLDAFDTRTDGVSDTVILVKNLPYEIKLEDIRNMFEKHGNLGRVVMPPSNTMALVEFNHAVDARTAFRSLAYRRIRNEPLYLEWAPKNVFSAEVTKEQAPMVAEEVETDQLKEDVDEDVDTDVATLFVKNLNFDTREDDLRMLFSRCGAVRSVSVAQKPNKKQPGTSLSLGFGFVEFKRRRDAMDALKTLQDTELQGHKLFLKLSDRKTQQSSGKSGSVVKAEGTKLLVKNVAFEATKKEIRELFASFGQVKSVRLPAKFDGNHRGFAFVEFTSKEEAKKAFEALSASTHLYGRRLVISFAKDEEGVAVLQEKTIRDMKRVKSQGSKKLAKRMHEFLS